MTFLKNSEYKRIFHKIKFYFDVSTDFLIGRTNDKRYYSSNSDNRTVNILYSKVKDLPEEQQQFILNVTNTIMNQIDKELDGK